MTTPRAEARVSRGYGNGVGALALATVVFGLLGLPSCDSQFEFDVHAPIEGGAANGGGSGHGGGGGWGFGGNKGTGGNGSGNEGCSERCTLLGLTCEEDDPGDCVECTNNNDCRRFPGFPRCSLQAVKNRCVQCVYDGDCGENEACSPRSLTCVPLCGKGAELECAADGAFCNDKKYCATCSSDAECQERGFSYCLEDQSRCVNCKRHEDCDEDTADFCDPVTFTCVGCTDSSNCYDREICNPWTKKCVSI